MSDLPGTTLLPLPLPLGRQLARPHRGGVEVAALFALYGLYEIVRGFGHASVDVARGHAGDIVALERSLGVYGERGVQEFAESVPGLPALLGVAYIVLHIVATAGILAWVYRSHRDRFPLVRTTLIASTALSLAVYVLYPVAPPRLAELGFADTVTTHARLNLSSDLLGSLYNPFAAVPSLHFGWSMLLGAVVAWVARHPVAYGFAVVWPVAMFFAVVMTGNHFILDAVAGAIVSFAGLGIALGVARYLRWPDLREPSPPPTLAAEE
jgi:membrane-associated phospholipid phosphatase